MANDSGPDDAGRDDAGRDDAGRDAPSDPSAVILDRQAVFAIVRDNLAEILEREPSTIAEGQSFGDDLEADSLALIELVEALEEDLAEHGVDLRIEDEDLEDLKTVRDAVDYVFARVEEA